MSASRKAKLKEAGWAGAGTPAADRTKNVQRLIVADETLERERVFVREPVDLMQEVREICVKNSPRLSLQEAVEEALRDWVKKRR